MQMEAKWVNGMGQWFDDHESPEGVHPRRTARIAPRLLPRAHPAGEVTGTHTVSTPARAHGFRDGPGHAHDTGARADQGREYAR